MILGNQVTPLNPAAIEFTRERIIDQIETFDVIMEKIEFCFHKLVPMPPILACIRRSHDLLVTFEELRQYKEANKGPWLITNHEKKGLIYMCGMFGGIVESRCTTKLAAKLRKKYGVATRENFAEKYWGPSDEITNAWHHDKSYYFDTWGNIALPFMQVMAQSCPQGQWQWTVSELFDTETLVIEIKEGSIFLEEHWIKRVAPEHDERDFKPLDSLTWPDAKFWDGEVSPQRALAAGQSLNKGEVYKVTNLHHRRF